jgi:hypothetical protein
MAVLSGFGHDRRMLEPLGLSAAEQSLYELLLTGAPAGADEPDEPETLRRLEELGLVTRLPQEPPRYAVIPPEAALAPLVAARERALDAARHRMNHLAARHRRTSASTGRPELVELVHGREATTDRVNQILRSARREVRMFDTPPYVDPGLFAPDPIELEQLGRGVRFRVLYDRRGVDLPGRLAHIEGGRAAGESARVADVPFKLLIGDHRVAVLPASNDPVESSLVVHDSVLLDALSMLFETLWERGVPLHVAERSQEDTPDETDRALLALLTAGLTDQAIAAHLGWHERTAHRRLRAMITRLDAATRFQAGYQAVRRGWLTGGADE